MESANTGIWRSYIIAYNIRNGGKNLKIWQILWKQYNMAKKERESKPGIGYRMPGYQRAELQEKCERIEQTAIEADADIYQWLLEGVTTDYATYIYLRDAKGLRAESEILQSKEEILLVDVKKI